MEPSVELRELTKQIARAVGAGDVAFLERHTSRQPGVAFLGTDPDEWWTGPESVRRALEGQVEAGVEVFPGEPVAYAAGDWGWAVDRQLRFRVGEREQPFRMSVVYRREAGVWRMVHFHSSLGVPNDAALGVTLPS